MPSQEDTRTADERAAWEAQKAETAKYIQDNRAWYEKTMTPQQLAALQQATAPAKGGAK